MLAWVPGQDRLGLGSLAAAVNLHPGRSREKEGGGVKVREGDPVAVCWEHWHPPVAHQPSQSMWCGSGVVLVPSVWV